MKRNKQGCKRCGAETDQVHDYRIRQVRDLELRGKPLRLLYRQRRYACPSCGKRFSEQNDFVRRYMRFTHRTGEKIMGLLRRRGSMKDIARDMGTSVSGVQRVFYQNHVALIKKQILLMQHPMKHPSYHSHYQLHLNASGYDHM